MEKGEWCLDYYSDSMCHIGIVCGSVDKFKEAKVRMIKKLFTRDKYYISIQLHCFDED